MDVGETKHHEMDKDNLYYYVTRDEGFVRLLNLLKYGFK